MNTFSFPAALCVLLAFGGCAQVSSFLRPDAGHPDGSPLDATGQAQPGDAPLSAEVRAVVSAPPPPAAARTADQFDTTTAAQRALAEAPTTVVDERRLGETVASLGDPNRAGFWIKSPLVTEPGSGRIENPATGKSAVVELIPLDGPASGGSQVSLAALRLIEAPLTDLPTLVVFAN